MIGPSSHGSRAVPKAGQPKPRPPTLQARHWFAEALLSSLLTRSRRAGYELALADVPRLPALIDKTYWALERVGIGLYLADKDSGIHRSSTTAAATARRHALSTGDECPSCRETYTLRA